MRVTEQSYISSFLRNINRNRSDMMQLENQLATQKRVNKPSDDPTAYANSQGIERTINKNAQYQNNITEGLNQAQSASGALSQMLDRLYQLKQLAVKGANGKNMSQQDMNTLADNVDAMKKALVDQGNTQVEGRYVFGGTKTDSPPFSDTNGTVTYNGNSESINIRISDSNSVNVSKNGDQLTNYKSGDTLFGMIDRIAQGLRAGDTTAVNAEIDNIDTAVGHISALNSDLGNNINQMQFANQQYDAANINLKSNVSHLVDTDFSAVMTQFQSLQTAYSAALSVHSQIMNTSLAKFL